MGEYISNETPESRLLPEVIDSLALHEPNKPFAYVPQTMHPVDGWRPVTFRQLSNAINHVAHEISNRKKHPMESARYPTIAYIGPSDTRYVIMVLACVKAECKALLVSPRNSSEAFASLFDKTNCRSLWYAGSLSNRVSSWVGGHDTHLRRVPEEQFWLQVSASPFPYDRTPEEAQWDPLMVLHTSGSTGLPEPVVIRHGVALIMDSLLGAPDFNGQRILWRTWQEDIRRMLLSFPLFHVGGIMTLFTLGIYATTPIALPVPGRPLDGELISECIEHSGVDCVAMPPSLIEEVSQTEKGIRLMKDLYSVIYGGNSLALATADHLTERGVRLQSLMSSTEHISLLCYAPPDPKLHRFFHFDSEGMGAEWRSTGENGVFELVFRRKDTLGPGNQAIFYTFPDLNKFSGKDLFRPHPIVPDCWEYVGRADDVITFSNGEKLNPVSMEQEILAGHPGLKGALVVGFGRLQAGIILEPLAHPGNDAEAQAILYRAWLLVQRLNQQTITHGRIARALVVLSDPATPFLRTEKGSVRRGQTTKAYKNFIDNMYATVKSTAEARALDFGSRRALTESLLPMFSEELGIGSLQAEDDFFERGANSLVVATIARILQISMNPSGIGLDPSALETSAIYTHPSVAKLADYLLSLKGQTAMVQRERAAQKELVTARAIQKQYNLSSSAPKPPPRNTDQTVLVTGTTGSLGSYVLDRLMALPHIKRVIAMNRGEDGGRARQLSIMEERGLGTEFSKVAFFPSDLADPWLGLKQEVFKDLAIDIDRIVHLAWPVNFNMSIESFEPHIRGVKNLASLSACASKAAPVVFASSIAAAIKWEGSLGLIPEIRLDDLTLADGGYGLSKLLGSLILDDAAERFGVPAANVRIGQVGGPRGVKGMWTKQELIPSLVASSLHLGMLPEELGPYGVTDWIPVEDVADILLDIAGVTRRIDVKGISGYYNVVNPTPVPWKLTVTAMHDYYQDRIDKLVTLAEWIATLEASADADAQAVPGITLLDTYKAMLSAGERSGHKRFATARAEETSPAMKQLQPITDELIQHWCGQWQF